MATLQATMAMHKIPGYDIYVGSLFALRGRQSLRDARVTHVLSALRGEVDGALVAGFEHLHLQVDDDEDEDLVQYFDRTNAFIRSGLAQGGAVLVHCIAGISRSVTIVCAYVMQDQQLGPAEALAIVRRGRPIANPNDAFLAQLELYGKCRYSTASPLYARFKLEQATRIATGMFFTQTRLTAAAGSAPTVTYRDSGGEDGLRCKKCRCALAQASAIIPHDPLAAGNTKIGPRTASVLPPACMHYFLDPVRWMKPELDRGELEGRLECPKCHTKIGSYRWQGMRCSCGRWVTPGISLQRGRVDERIMSGL